MYLIMIVWNVERLRIYIYEHNNTYILCHQIKLGTYLVYNNNKFKIEITRRLRVFHIRSADGLTLVA